jgi:hypothetical protein
LAWKTLATPEAIIYPLLAQSHQGECNMVIEVA